MRAFLLAFFLLLPANAFAASNPGRIAFEVLRNGQPFGAHVIEVTAAADRLNVASRAELRAGVGPVTLFRYEQACRESWSQGALVSLDCTTLRNGKATHVAARLENGRLRVAGVGRDALLPPSALPTSWWTKPPASVTSMIDTETGALRPLRVSDLGRDIIQIDGRDVEARRIRLEGALAVDLWYDSDDRWIGCAFTARGQRIEYRLVSPRQAAPS